MAKRRTARRDRRTALSLARNFRLCPIEAGIGSEIGGAPEIRDPLIELAWDGHRVLATRRGDDVHIASADFQPWHDIFAPVAIALRRLPADEIVIEGHLCALDAAARPDFERLRRFVAERKRERIALAVWDLLFLDGQDLRSEPLRDRRTRLAALLAGASPLLLWSEALDGARAAVLRAVGAAGLRGIVVRDAAAAYPPDPPSLSWPADPAVAVAWDRSLSPPPKVTNADKILFPRDGLSKTDVVAYYRDVADVLLAHMRQRPIVGQRWPDGIDDFTWFQHRVPPRAPDYLKPTMIDGDRRIVIEGADAMLWLVNQAVITSTAGPVAWARSPSPIGPSSISIRATTRAGHRRSRSRSRSDGCSSSSSSRAW